MKLLLPLMIVFAIAMSGKADACESSCPQGWYLFQKSCYRYFGERVTWEEALKRCRKLYSTNGQADLISIHSRQENDFAYDLFAADAGIIPSDEEDSTDYGAWIGFYQQTPGSTGHFVWSDGTENEDFSAWLPDEPSNDGKEEDCAHFWRRTAIDDTLRQWNDLRCYREVPYICKVAPNC